MRTSRRGIVVRHLLKAIAALLAVCLLFGAAQAAARSNDKPRSCKQRLNQLINYDDVALRAKQQGDKMWEQSTYGVIARLEEGLKQKCPVLYEGRMKDTRMVRAGRFLKKMVVLAAKAAKTYFTGGLM
jgi:hypothetical protein